MTSLLHSLAYDRILDLITDPVRNDAAFTLDEVSLWVLTEVKKRHPTFSHIGHKIHWDYIRTQLQEQNHLWLIPLGVYYWLQARIDDINNKVDDRVIHNKSLAGLCGGATYGFLAVNHRADLGLVLTKLVRSKITINGSAASLDNKTDAACVQLPVKAPDKAVIKRGLGTLKIQNGHPKRIKV